MELGHKPPAELLEQNLVQEKSNKQDVLDALGTPRGYGIISLPEFEGPPRTIWYYEYLRAGGGKLDMTLLLVFFDREKYDGYLWYASKEKLVEGK